MSHLPDWDSALCAQTDPEAWFPETGQTNHYAIKICHTCPIQTACLTWAIDTKQQHGIWGGTTPQQRRQQRFQTSPAYVTNTTSTGPSTESR